MAIYLLKFMEILMAIRENGEVLEVINTKTSNLNYEYNVIDDLLEICARNNIWVEIISEEGK